MLSEMVSSAALPHSGDLFNFHCQVALAPPNNLASEPFFTTQIRYLYNYCRLVVPIRHIPAAFPTPFS